MRIERACRCSLRPRASLPGAFVLVASFFFRYCCPGSSIADNVFTRFL